MKKTFLFGISFLISWLNLSSQYVTIEGRQFKDENGNDFYPVVCNYQVNLIRNDTIFDSIKVSPKAACGLTFGFDCGCDQPCDTQLINDFKYILSMGFSAIRVMGLEVIYLPQGYCFKNENNQQILWTVPVSGFYSNPLPCPSYQFYPWTLITQPFSVNNAEIVFDRIRYLLQLVSNTEYQGRKLKVIFLTGRAWSQGDSLWDDNFYSEYPKYLSALSGYISSLPPQIQQTILAYDLINEPNTFTLGHSKAQICENTKIWYDSIRKNDGNHLITMGGGGPFDVFHNDPLVLKIDFYLPHLYPLLKSFEYDNQNYLTAQTDRLRGAYYWLQQECPMPWMIGETGFTTHQFPDSVQPVPSAELYGIWGTWNDLDTFIQTTLAGTWQCGGSGFSWWDYQGDRFGLLYSKRQILPPDSCGPLPACCHDSLDVKKAHHNFETFTIPIIGACSIPDHYYDPFNHQTYSLNQNIITGTVTEKNNPLHPGMEGAYLKAWTRLYDIIDSTGKRHPVWHEHYTFTDENGHYRLIPYDYDPHWPDYNRIEQIWLSASGASVDHISAFMHKKDTLNLIQDFELEKYSFKYDDVVAHLVISPPDERLFQAWNSLTLYDDSIEPQGKAEFKARREISINAPFQSKLNSETWIHTGDTWPDCALLDFSDQSQIKSSDKTNNQSESVAKEIELDFKTGNDKIVVYPNPTEGVVNIKIEEMTIPDRYDIFLADQYGRILINFKQNRTSFQLDLSGLAKGIYFLIVTSDHEVYNTKIVHI